MRKFDIGIGGFFWEPFKDQNKKNNNIPSNCFIFVAIAPNFKIIIFIIRGN